MSGKKLEEIVRNYRAVAEALGRSPSQAEYLAHPLREFSKRQISNYFGTWIQLMRAAGHTPSSQANVSKVDKQEVKKKYYEHILSELERLRTEPIEKPPAHRLLVIGDIHAPYVHPNYIPWLIELHKKYNFDRVCSVGDEIDHSSISFHEKDPNALSPGYELEAAIKALQPLYEAFPEMNIAESNHGALHFRKGKHAGLPRPLLATYHDAIKAPPGWRWMPEIRVELSNGKHCIIHHSLESDVLKASQNRGESLIFGHVHSKAGVQWWSNGKENIFAAYTGCGIDPTALAFAYNKLQPKRPLLGAVVVIEGVPQWLPMPT